ncbi:hypothetical protein KGQ19_46515 [Catenulispora sp. NL8]|uniref:Uncharacterized protein n=1 Tax=Catenulispora pinistramenti TaxID=2705254 RepID=A0ABS5L7N3_9ACTN|nr:hypothetical protein [Catenulispora pinistramenti]MBS2554334.1 hypothetical protein [Catenulispora pinistramenti]
MIAVAPAVLFGAVVWLQLRNRSLGGLDAALVFLFTLFFVQTSIGHAVSDWVGTLLHTHDGGGHVVPPTPPLPSGTSGQVHQL